MNVRMIFLLLALVVNICGVVAHSLPILIVSVGMFAVYFLTK